MLSKNTLYSPHKLFFVIALLFGSIFLFVTQPFRAPDEAHHLTRIIGLSEGHLLSAADAPASYRDFINTLEKRAQVLHKEEDNPTKEAQFTLQDIYTHFGTFFSNTNNESVPLERYNRAVINSPASYISAIPVAWIALHINASPIVAFYAVRISLFLAGTLLVYYAIRITPVLKWQLFLLALFPCTAFIRSSISADPITLGYAFLFIALLNRRLFSDSAVTTKDIIELSILSILLCLSKFVYFLLAGSIFLLPLNKFTSKKQYTITLLGILVLPIILNAYWFSLTSHLFQTLSYGTDDSFQVPLGVEPKAQLLYILSNPLTFLRNLLFTGIIHAYNFFPAMFGWLGLCDIGMPLLLVFPAFCLLFVLPFQSFHGTYTILSSYRQVCAYLFIALFLIIILALYIGYTPVGYVITEGIQGRYFTPIMPLLLMATAHRSFVYSYPIMIKGTIAITLFMLVCGVIMLLFHDYSF